MRNAKPADLARAVERCLLIAAPRNLSLLAELDYWFVNPEGEIARLGQLTLSGRVREALRDHYKDRPEALSAQLEHASHNLLHHLCWSPERRSEGSFAGLPFDGWPSFADTILAAGEQQPEVMLPLIAHLVTRSRDMSSGRTLYDYDQALAKLLFGSARVVTLFRSHASQLGATDGAYVAVKANADSQPED